MESLVFVFGMLAGGIVAVIIMAMLFVAKRADEVDDHAIVGDCYSPVETSQQKVV